MREPAPRRWTAHEIFVDLAIGAVLLIGVGFSVLFASPHLDFIARL